MLTLHEQNEKKFFPHGQLPPGTSEYDMKIKRKYQGFLTGFNILNSAPAPEAINL
jgi:hypothetical protein